MGKKAKTEKKEILPGVELIIILVFFLSFIMWAVTKCNHKKNSYLDVIPDKIDSTLLKNKIVDEILLANIQDSVKKQKDLPKEIPQNRPAPIIQTIIEKHTPLYVSVEGLKLRSGPGLQFEIIKTLVLHEELSFLHEVSDSTEALNIGNVIVHEPWVKVRHQKGQIGWVYGGYVDYYKKIILSE